MVRGSIIVHGIDHARAAIGAAAGLGVPVTLLSAPAAAASLGAAVFREMIAQAARDPPAVPVTAVLDCGSDAGRALGALRQGVRAVRLEAPDDVRAKVADIAAQLDARLDDGGDEETLDLLDSADAPEACRRWLAGATGAPGES